jgi:hypothetical protein
MDAFSMQRDWNVGRIAPILCGAFRSLAPGRTESRLGAKATARTARGHERWGTLLHTS